MAATMKKAKQLQNLEDACEDIMLADEDCLMIPYQIGDVFISHSQEETQDMLEEAKLHSYLMGGWRGSGRSHACDAVFSRSGRRVYGGFFVYSDMKNLQEEIDALESRVESIQRVLADLKVQLYAKFGSNINLEADES
ncbi:prefoldin subunit 4 isoform X2 [Myotis yumanensis]|uniref:prefoldin subunit 4 isoform X2 n=1 Tax=Myotis yumanensis TaxID=159337 RepID=UPI0038D1DFB3